MRPLFIEIGNIHRKYSLNNADYEVEFIRSFKNAFGFTFCASLSHRSTPLGINGLTEVLLPFRQLKSNIFSSINWNDITPLDDSILSLMKKHEFIALKICARMMIGNTVEEQMDVYLKSLRYCYHILKTHEIDIIIDNGIPHSTMPYLFHILGKALNIPTTCTVLLPYLKSKVIVRCISNDIENILDTKMLAKKTIAANEKNTQTGCVSDKWLAELFSAYSTEVSQVIIDAYSGDKKRARKDYKALYSSFLLRNPFRKRNRYRVQKLKEHHASTKFYEDNSVLPDYSEKYIYFPLHVQPEASTLPLGRYFVEQQLVAQMISYQLPNDVHLYIKEHPAINPLGILKKNRSVEYYEQLLAIKNVRLIKKNVNSMELVRNSVAVATITGNVSWEAIFNNKPVLIFGDCVCKYAPGAFAIQTNEDCKQAIDRILMENLTIDIEDIKRFVYSILDVIFDEALIVNEEGRYELNPLITSFVSNLLYQADGKQNGCKITR